MMGPGQTAKADQKVDLNQRRLQLARTRGGEAPGAGELQASLVEVHLLVRLRSLSGSHHEFPPLSDTASYNASRPCSPVRTRTTSSTGTVQILPSPIRPVCAALRMTDTTSGASTSSTTTSTRSFGTKSTVYSAPR